MQQAKAQPSWFVCCLLQPIIPRKLQATQAGRVCVTVPPALLRAAFGGNWQQAGFKVQLSVFKDGGRVAGRRSAANQRPHPAR
jgi:hypothetical protein